MSRIAWFLALAPILLTVMTQRGWAQVQPQPGEMVRMGVLTSNPAVVADLALAIFKKAGASRAGEFKLGQKTGEGYYFHTSVEPAVLDELARSLPGRIVVNVEPDPRGRKLPKTHRRIILTVSQDFAAEQKDQIRIYQLVHDPIAVAEDVRQRLSRDHKLPIHGISVRPLRGPSSRAREIRATLDRDQFDALLADIQARGPFGTRREQEIPDGATSFRVRYVIDTVDEPSATSTPGTDGRSASAGIGWLHVLRLSMTRAAFSSAQMRETLQKLGAKKAGQVELGETVDGRPYYHFALPEDRLDDLTFLLLSHGSLQVERRAHPRKMPPGQARALLEVRVLTAEVPAEQERRDLARPETTEPATPSTERPKTMNRALEVSRAPGQGSLQAHQLFVESLSPELTYESQPTLRGYAPEGVSVSDDRGPVQIDGSRQFTWVLTEIPIGSESLHHIRTRTEKDEAEFVYRTLRVPAADVYLGTGLAATEEGSLRYIGSIAGRYWFERFLSGERSSWSHQRFGLEAYASFPWGGDDTVTAAPAMLLDLNYRFSAGVQNRGRYFVGSLSAATLQYSGDRTEFGGFGLRYADGFPEFFDQILNLLPFLRFEKRYEIGVHYYPFLIGSSGEVSTNLFVHFEPKMFFTPRLYLVGRLQWMRANYLHEDTETDFNFLIGQGGLGYLF